MGYKDKVLGADKRRKQILDQVKGFTFPAFVDYVLNEYKRDRTCQDNSYDNHSCVGIERHWKPFYSTCSYCDVTYDVIGTSMESFHDDLKYIILKQNLENHIPLWSLSIHTHSTRAKGETKAKTLKYFSKLSKSKIQRIYEMYRLDFEMFNYDLSSYIS